MRFTRKENGIIMTPEEIKERNRKNLDSLLYYQSIGTYNRKKIDKLKEERDYLQSICPHVHIERVTDSYTNDIYTVCTDCGKVLPNE